MIDCAGRVSPAKGEVMPRPTIYRLLATTLFLSLIGGEALAQRAGSPSHVQVVQFADYAYREPADVYDEYGGHYEFADRTTFLAFNGSLVEAKVRVQAFFSNGDLAWEYDQKIPSMGASQILRYTLDQESKQKPGIFVVSSETEVILTVHTIESQLKHQFLSPSSDSGAEPRAYGAQRAAQTHVPVKGIDCSKPAGYELLCAAPTKNEPWSFWIPAP
jgi:hypothetical protein